MKKKIYKLNTETGKFELYRNNTGNVNHQIKGFSYRKDRAAKGLAPFAANITIMGKYHFIGYYKTPEEAHEAWVDAKKNGPPDRKKREDRRRGQRSGSYYSGAQGKWIAHILHEGKYYKIGSFITKEEADNAFKEADIHDVLRRHKEKKKNKGTSFCEKRAAKGLRAWRAQYWHHGKTHHIGNFYTQEEAIEAFQKKTKELGK